MKEYIYPNIWRYCEAQYPASQRRQKWLRALLLLFAAYYLLMCFAYLFAMVLAIRYEGVDFVSSGQAVNLLVVMLLSIAAEVAGWVCSLRRAALCGLLLSAGTALLSPFALWSASINIVFKIHHLAAMLLLLAVQALIYFFTATRQRKIRKKYNQTVLSVLAAHSKEDALLTREETERLLENFVPGQEKPQKPLKRSQKNRRRKEKNQ